MVPPMMIDFQTDPSRYRHWRLELDGEVAHLIMDVDEDGGLFEGYELKLNSYDLGVDIELNDAIQRLRFEHPEVKTVVMKSGKDNVFCAGANIKMLAGASHTHKVNFCKFTNETRNAIEEATAKSGQTYMAAVKGACAGGGYEIAVASDHIILADDGSSNVALPEVPLLAVLPGTGGLTRVTDKRKVRRDLADVFSTMEEGVRGTRALDWRLVDEIAPTSRFDETARDRATALAAASDRPTDARGVNLTLLDRMISGNEVRYPHLTVQIDRAGKLARFCIAAPNDGAPESPDHISADGFWPLALTRALDDAILHMRLNEPEIGVWTIVCEGDPDWVAAHDAFLNAHAGHWLVREINLFWKRTMKRLDVTSRSLVALIEPGSCFTGFLAEIVFACDRSYMADGPFDGDNRPPATLTLTPSNFGPYPMSNDLIRLETRFYGEPDSLESAEAAVGEVLDAERCEQLGLVTFVHDNIDWEDEVRIFLEERASFSPDALVGMEANLRFAGPETMETRIFGRLTAWQNWIFQRPGAVGPEGALQRYGTGKKGQYTGERT